MAVYPDDPERCWVMVTDQAGPGDKGFNDLAFAGITPVALSYMH